MAKTKAVIYKIFYAIFFCAFLIVFGKVLFADTIYDYSTLQLLLYLIPAAAIILLTYILLSKYRTVIERYYRIILAVFVAIYGVLILVFGFQLRFTPTFDMDSIYGGAIEWLQTGTFSDYYEYYGYFPNNLGAMTILHLIFSIAHVFGISDFFAVGIIFNSLLLSAAVLVTSLVCKKLKDSVAGVMALVFFLVCIPFLFMGAAFYTDSLSVLFPILFYYLYLHFKEQKTWKRRLIFAGCMAVVLSIGMMIKFTVLIVLLAVIIDALLCLNWKDVCLLAGCSVFLALASFGIMNTYMYSQHLDKEMCEQLNTPYLHWVMMGMQNNGSYSPEDYEYTRSYGSDERNEACLARIEERVRDMGFIGLMELFVNKANVCFGDGSYALSDFLDDTPENESWLHPYILYEGEKFSGYRHLTTGLLLTVYLFMLIGALQCLFLKKDPQGMAALAPRLASLGILAFLLLWETSGRYFTNFVPLMLVCAVLSFVFKRGGKEDV